MTDAISDCIYKINLVVLGDWSYGISKRHQGHPTTPFPERQGIPPPKNRDLTNSIRGTCLDRARFASFFDFANDRLVDEPPFGMMSINDSFADLAAIRLIGFAQKDCRLHWSDLRANWLRSRLPRLRSHPHKGAGCFA